MSFWRNSGGASTSASAPSRSTSVKDTAGDKIGTVEDLVLDKQTNTILFAVVSFGGVLGMGEKYHPLPWAVLNYDEEEDSYVVPYTKDELKAAPADSMDELTKNDGVPYRDQSYAFYRVEQYWT